MGNLRNTVLAARTGLARASVDARVAGRLGPGRYTGDPFWGSLAGLVGKKLLPKAVGWLGRAAKRTIGGAARRAGQVLRSPVGGAVVGGGAAGAAGELISRGLGGVPAPITMMMPRRRGSARVEGEAVRRRRMNSCNPRALSRAIRRMNSFVKMYRRSMSHLGYTMHRRGAARLKGRKR